MFEKLITLLERFVLAQEAMVRIEAKILEMGRVPAASQQPSDPAPAYTATTVTKQEPPSTVVTKVIPADQWNPFLSPVQARYGADKVAVLDGLLAERSMPVTGTGGEKHKALLDWAEAKKMELENKLTGETPPFDLDAAPQEAPQEAPTQEAPTQEAPTQEATPRTIDDVRALARDLMAKKVAPTHVQGILEKVGGSTRLPEINPEKLGAVYDALFAELGKVA